MREIRELELSARATKCLVQANITSVEQLLERLTDYDQILALANGVLVTAREIYSSITSLKSALWRDKGLSIRASNRLAKANISNEEQLAKRLPTYADILKLNDCGHLTAQEISSFIGNLKAGQSDRIRAMIKCFRQTNSCLNSDDEQVYSTIRKKNWTEVFEEVLDYAYGKDKSLFSRHNVDDVVETWLIAYEFREHEEQEKSNEFIPDRRIYPVPNIDLIEWEEIAPSPLTGEFNLRHLSSRAKLCRKYDVWDEWKILIWLSDGYLVSEQREHCPLERQLTTDSEEESQETAQRKKTYPVPLLALEVSQEKWNGLSELPLNSGRWSTTISKIIIDQKFSFFSDIAHLSEKEWLKHPNVSSGLVLEIISELRKNLGSLKVTLPLLNRMVTTGAWQLLKETEIEELNWANRLLKILKQKEIQYLSELAKMTDRQLLNWRGVGKNSVKEIQEKISISLKLHYRQPLLEKRSVHEIEEGLLTAVFGSVEEGI